MADREHRPVGALFERLLDDGKAYAQAEFNLARVKVEEKALSFRKAAILAGIGIGFAFAAIVCLCLAIVLVLTNWFGAWGAAGAVVIVTALAALFLWLGYRSLEVGNEE